LEELHLIALHIVVAGFIANLLVYSILDGDVVALLVALTVVSSWNRMVPMDTSIQPKLSGFDGGLALHELIKPTGRHVVIEFDKAFCNGFCLEACDFHSSLDDSLLAYDAYAF